MLYRNRGGLAGAVLVYIISHGKVFPKNLGGCPFIYR